jgi:acyl-CoA thioesterase
MALQDLENALTLTRSAEGVWKAHADPNYESANGMFGGWTTAVAVRAVSESSDGKAQPSAISINFVNKIEPDSHLLIRTRRVGGGRSVSHWQAELISEDERQSLASAVVVLAERRDSDGKTDVAMPDAPDPDTVEATHPAPGPAGERKVMRPIEGFPPFGRATTYSTAWVRETSGRPVDHFQLAFLADFRPPRSFFWSDGPRPSATLALSVYYHATDEELAEVGDDDLLSEAFGVRGAQSTSEEHLRLWSRHGALLATSVQMAWYR